MEEQKCDFGEFIGICGCLFPRRKYFASCLSKLELTDKRGYSPLKLAVQNSKSFHSSRAIREGCTEIVDYLTTLSQTSKPGEQLLTAIEINDYVSTPYLKTSIENLSDML